ncbi:ABC transporter permease [Paenibacillus thermoaerophilus]|nr:ABC transporter permease [Paenibacillus thermoaerophilus]
MLAIGRKEMSLYFYTPTSYIAFAFFFLLFGFFFSNQFLYDQIVDVRPIFDNIVFLFVFAVPLLTMRLVSDELRQGTDELLFTSPASITEIVLGKYLAALGALLLLVFGSFLYPLILSRFGDLDQPVLWMSYLGMFLMGAAMMAVGLFASTLSSHQMVTGIAAFAMLIVLWVIDWLFYSKFPDAREWIEPFSIVGRMKDLNKGIFDLADVLFYVTFSAVFIVLSIQILERKRWR